MSDDTEKEGVVIDVTPEPEEAQEAPPPGAPSRREKAGRTALILAAAALVLVVVGLLVAYLYSRHAMSELASIEQRLGTSLAQQSQLHAQLASATQAVEQQAAQIAAQKTAIQQQQQIVSDARQQFKAQDQLLTQARQKMQEREDQLRASVADVRQRIGASGTQWMVAEADYLLRLANTRLDLARDVGTARSALQLADQRLAETGDPGWTPVRNQIAQEISALDAIRMPDVTGLSARLGALIGQVSQLRLADGMLGGPGEREAGHAGVRSEPNGRSWKAFADDLWSGFRDTIRIRHDNKPVKAMLPPDQQYFLYENLRLMLDSARLALLRGDQSLYDDSLATVTRWLGSYFARSDALTQAMQKQLASLAKVDVHPALPDISQSLRTLQARGRRIGALLPGGNPDAAGHAQ